MCPSLFINRSEWAFLVLLPKSACLLRGAVPEIERFLPALRLRTEEIIARCEELSPVPRFYRLLVVTKS